MTMGDRFSSRLLRFVVAVLVALGVIAIVDSPRAADRAAPYDPSHVLVAFRTGTPAAVRAAAHAAEGTQIVNRLEWLNLDVVRLPDGLDPLAAVTRYSHNPHVAYAHPNWRVTFASVPDDALFHDQWHLHNTGQAVTGGTTGVRDADIDAPRAWTEAFGRRRFRNAGGTRVAVIDTGIDLAHADLLGKVKECAQANVGTGDVVEGVCADEVGHGTHLAGVIAADTNNGVGVAGIAPNSSLAIFKVNRGLEASVVDVIAGIHWARTVGRAKVINMSFGVEENRALKRELSAAYEAGTLLVAAAGNQGDDTRLFPASHPDVISAAATTQRDRHASFSNCNADVELSAPGSFPVWSTWAGNSYLGQGGTSVSSPGVAGAGAMVMWAEQLNNVQVRMRLVASADDLGPQGRDPCFGFGRINLAKAIRGRPRFPACTVSGTRRDDVLVGSPRVDVVCGRRGDDRIIGKRNADVLRGGRGSDRLRGNRGRDTLRGRLGRDFMDGGAGRDVCRGGGGRDRRRRC